MDGGQDGFLQKNKTCKNKVDLSIFIILIIKMGQVLANLSSNLNIVYSEEEKISIENHIPFKNNGLESVTWDKIMSYLDKEQKFRYKIKEIYVLSQMSNTIC